jgi:hypothetical protein
MARHKRLIEMAYRKFSDLLKTTLAAQSEVSQTLPELEKPAGPGRPLSLATLATLAVAHTNVDARARETTTTTYLIDNHNIFSAGPANCERLSTFEDARSQSESAAKSAKVAKADESDDDPSDNISGWLEALARLDRANPPADIPLKRWRRFLDDARLFIENGFAAQAIGIGWHPLDLFGCDRDRPFARIDCAGLLWLLNGDKLIALSQNTATMEARTGTRLTWRRTSIEPDRVLAWELSCEPPRGTTPHDRSRS